MFQSFYAYLIYLTFISIFLLGSKIILHFVIFRHTHNTAICRVKSLPVVILGIADVILFSTNSSILNMDLLFRHRQRRIITHVSFLLCLWGIKFTDHIPSVVNGVKFPIKQEPPVCRGWHLVCWKKGILVVERSPGISSFATHYFGPGFR